MPKICSVESCSEEVHALGMCNRHYRRYKRETSTKVCSIKHCHKKAVTRGMCNSHYRSYMLYGTPHKRLRLPYDGLRKAHYYEYHTYHQMKHRCSEKAVPKDKRVYYDKGIGVCQRWLGTDGFKHFYDDMGECPKGYSLDRIDPTKGYSPENCRWASTIVQARNKRPVKKKYSQHIGIGKHPPTGLWKYSMQKNGKRYGGYEKTEEEAIRKWESLNQKLYGGLEID